MTLATADLSVNQLTVQATSAEGPTLLAYETTGAVLSHRIELRFSADLDFSPIATPSNWNVQVSLVNEGGVPIQVATYYYVGSTATSSGEFFNFANPWRASYRLSAPGPASPETTALTTPVSVEVNASSVVPGFGIIPASAAFALAAALTSEQTQREFDSSIAAGDPTGPTLRLSFTLPGIVYHIESTEDLQTWDERMTFASPVALTDRAVPLGGGWKKREFFRVIPVPVQPSP